MSVTVTVNVSSLSGGLTPGAYILVTLLNCGAAPSVVNTSTAVPVTQKFYPYNGSVACTLYDNITQIVCEGFIGLSYYSFSLVSSGVTTFIKNVILPPGVFNLANLANVTTPPWTPGVIQGPSGPNGPSGVGGTAFTVQLIGAVDGTNRVFSFPFSNTPSLLALYNNGLWVDPFGTAPQGYTTLTNTVTFNTAPVVGSILRAQGTY